MTEAGDNSLGNKKFIIQIIPYSMFNLQCLLVYHSTEAILSQLLRLFHKSPHTG